MTTDSLLHPWLQLPRLVFIAVEPCTLNDCAPCRKVATFELSLYPPHILYFPKKDSRESWDSFVSTYWTPGCLRRYRTSSVPALASMIFEQVRGRVSGGGRGYMQVWNGEYSEKINIVNEYTQGIRAVTEDSVQAWNRCRESDNDGLGDGDRFVLTEIR